MPRRPTIFVATLVALAAAALGIWFGVGRALNSDAARHRVETVLSDALHRPVTIESLHVAQNGSSVEATGVRIANVHPFGEGPLLTAERLVLETELEELLDRRVVGRVSVEGVHLQVLRSSETTNLHGMVVKKGLETSPVDLDLDVEVRRSEVRVEDLDRGEALTLQGVDISLELSNADGHQDAGAVIEIASVELHGVEVNDVRLRGRLTSDAFVVEELIGRIGEHGSVRGSGRANVRGDEDWEFSLDVRDVELDKNIVPIAATFLPVLAAAAVPEGGTLPGRVSCEIELAGRGLHWDVVRKTMTGRGVVELEDAELPREALLGQVANAVGAKSDPLKLDQAKVRFQLAQGWVELAGVELSHRTIALPLEGRVSLEGALDLRVDLLPLLALADEETHRQFSHYATSVPVRVRGTVDEPQVEPPSRRDVGRSLVGGLIRRTLTE